MNEEAKKQEASCELDGLEVKISRSETDGVLVVNITMTGELELAEDGVSVRGRVYLNDDPIYQNPPFDLDAFEEKYGKLDEEED